ncbi:hypothetical protein E2C01_015431 [Portunus trituberculatus]|uniref:Uncharacterized protein n=1 Tax=Portunus trituberculatus TaxID=210409 RepID=A0A5B7DMR4_PORTR|nr:hypothetical protein [Portunus trituberculatus]
MVQVWLGRASCVGVSVGSTHRWGKAATFPGQPLVVRQAPSITASAAATVSDLQPRPAIPLRVCLTEVMASSSIAEQDTNTSDYRGSLNVLKNYITIAPPSHIYPSLTTSS